MTNDDWKVGDLAVCIADNWCCEHGNCCRSDHPKKEEVLRVNDVTGMSLGLMLGFDGKASNTRWHHTGFRKVRPDIEPAADEQWVEQLKRFRRKVDA